MSITTALAFEEFEKLVPFELIPGRYIDAYRYYMTKWGLTSATLLYVSQDIVYPEIYYFYYEWISTYGDGRLNISHTDTNLMYKARTRKHV